MTEQNRHTNCVLLRQSAADDDRALFDHLRSRNWRIETTACPHQAFARLCLHERLESARSSWGLERHMPPVLVIDADSTPALHQQLLAACDQYISGIGIWQWRAGQLETLRTAAPQPPPPAVSQAGHSAPPARSPAASFNGPMLRLHEPPEDAPRTGAQNDQVSQDDNEAACADRAESLSSDEVNMLMGSGEEPASS